MSIKIFQKSQKRSVEKTFSENSVPFKSLALTFLFLDSTIRSRIFFGRCSLAR